MTPAARAAAAIDILDRWLTGTPAEQAVTCWGRASRFAGSSDRAAVRDIVFQAIRWRDSCAHRGGGLTGRGLVIGLLRENGSDPAALFTGEGHAPAPVTDDESDPGPATGLAALDCPGWLVPQLEQSLGADFAPVMQALRHRAPVFLRVNKVRSLRDDAMLALAEAGIGTQPHPLAETALQVMTGERRIAASAPYGQGMVELQDAASQAVVMALPLKPGDRVLDYCAGGGGKALAMAALGAQVTAWDASAARMRDLPGRAARAGVPVSIADRPKGAFDLVLADAPCSGSGAWRRQPEAKWALTPERLAALVQTQAAVMDAAARHVRPGGHFAYATCSLLEAENAGQVRAFAGRQPMFRQTMQRVLTPLDGGDGFFLAIFRREA